MKRLLLSNDDGVYAPGLRQLAVGLGEVGEVTVMAPLTEQSAASHALTLHHPLRVQRVEERIFGVLGTPTDCVLLAVKEFLGARPDLVVSGINQGPNMGEDVIYSGTVAAAMEGALLGIPSVALSLASWEYRDYEAAVAVSVRLVRTLLARSLPERLLLNVNIPPLPASGMRGIRVSRLGSRVYNDAIVKKTDPRGRDYYWIGGAAPSWTPSSESDFAAVEAGYVSVTPILLDFTDSQGFEFLRSLDLEA